MGGGEWTIFMSGWMLWGVGGDIIWVDGGGWTFFMGGWGCVDMGGGLFWVGGGEGVEWE